MKFDYTYLSLFGYPVFEPMVIVTNLIFFIQCTWCFSQLVRSSAPYGRRMAWFILLMGVAGCFGATIHATHYQLGMIFYQVFLFITNTLNLLSVYFCFLGSYTWYTRFHGSVNKKLIGGVLAWIVAVIGFTLYSSDFVIIKIHAGLALIYSLAAHYLSFRRTGERGSRIICTGIVISFLSIVAHSLKISFHAWFNHKDLSHVIMIISLAIIYKGIRLNVKGAAAKDAAGN